jgi:ATP-binding cassette subfamily B protein
MGGTGGKTGPIGSDEDEASIRPLSLALIRRMWTFTRPYRRIRNTLLVVVLVRSIQLSGVAALLGWVIKDLIAHRSAVRLVWGTLAFAVVAISTEVLLHWRQLLALRLGEYVVHDLRGAIYRRLQSLTMDFYTRTKLGRIISRMTSDAEAVRAGVQNVLFVTLVNLGQMLGAAAFMAVIDWRLFLVVLAISPVLVGINHLFSQRFATAFRNLQESFSRVTATIAESVNGIRVTQGFNRERENARQFGQLVASHAHHNLVTARLRGFFLPLLDLNTQVFLVCLLLLGGHLSLQRDLPVGDIIQFFFLANVFFAPIRTLGNNYTEALTAMAGAERVFRMLDTEPAWRDPPGATNPGRLAGRVEFVKVDFAYDPGKPVLHDINFVAEPGQCVALVGQTGSGKSTIINLIAKFYLPGTGRIEIDSVDLRTFDIDALHRQMGIVLQVNFLFTGTVLDNIRIARPDADLATVVTAAEALGCRDLIEDLPDGFATQVGEGGSGISLGQRQLICFCRAMLADPRILILDEATSAVDTITEARIQKALARLLAGRTSFVVAHRLSTIRHADLVLVLKDGRIVERGTHRELLVEGGEYAAAYRRFLRGTE